MKNKTIIASLIVFGVIVIAAGFYFAKQNKSPADSSKNSLQQNQNNISVNSNLKNTTANQISASDAKTNNQKIVEQPQNKLVTDDFSINLPTGWKKTAPIMGTSAMAVNINENNNDPAVQKINFKSYFAVSYDTLQGKNINSYSQTVKDGILQSISNASFIKEEDLTINGNSAHIIEAELSQQGVNFKILMVVIAGQKEDVWVISFNTTKNSWNSYKETFYNIANSFILKK